MSAAVAYWLGREAAGTLAVLRVGSPQIRALTERRLSAVLQAACRAPDFQRRLREAGLRPEDLSGPHPDELLRALAPVDKQALRRAGTSALALGRVSPSWHVSTSSGSTGEPFDTYFDARTWAVLKHLVKVRSRLANGLRPYDRVAILDAIDPEQEGTTALERLGRVRRISVFRSGAEMAERIASFRPRALYGLASALLEAGAALRTAGASLRVPLVFTSGEVMLGGTRRALGAAFGARVLDVYGSSEMKEVAWECASGGMHLNADVVLFEVLGPDGQRAAPGVEGDVVLTSLVNVAMPMIRFRVGDRGMLSEGRCACGVALPLVGVVTGRLAEVLDLGGRRVSPYVLTSALEKIEGMIRYQVRQTGPARLLVRSVLSGGADREALSAAIRDAVARAVPVDLTVDVEFVDRLDTGPGGKTRVVQPLVGDRP